MSPGQICNWIAARLIAGKVSPGDYRNPADKEHGSHGGMA